MNSQIDHLVVTAPDLDLGIDYVRRTLGVSPQGGGEHPRMGTHNRLLRLGETSFLEVIAPNPAATRPPRPRWFALDELPQGEAPRLATWVATTDSIHAAARACGNLTGEIEPMTRGDLEWLITIPADGSLPFNGTAPALIEWGTEQHPAASLPDSGCELQSLELFHQDPHRLHEFLDSIQFSGPVTVSACGRNEKPGLLAHLRTPIGTVLLDGRRAIRLI